MTRIELIKLIGNVLTKLDVLRGSLLPDEPNRIILDRLREDLDARQLKLVQEEFDFNTPIFQQVSADLETANNRLKQTINKLEKVVKTIENLRRLITVVDDIINIVLPII